MTVFTAHVENGAVVLDTPMSLPDGARLRVELVEPANMHAGSEADDSLSSWLLSYASKVRDLHPRS